MPGIEGGSGGIGGQHLDPNPGDLGQEPGGAHNKANRHKRLLSGATEDWSFHGKRGMSDNERAYAQSQTYHPGHLGNVLRRLRLEPSGVGSANEAIAAARQGRMTFEGQDPMSYAVRDPETGNATAHMLTDNMRVKDPTQVARQARLDARGARLGTMARTGLQRLADRYTRHHPAPEPGYAPPGGGII